MQDTMVLDSREKARTLLPNAVEFHGHLGPYLVLGIRMGAVAESILKPKGIGDLRVLMSIRLDPPVSCALDGVQVASGCTLGKGTIRTSEASDRIVGRFQVGSQICTIAVKNHLLDELSNRMNKATDRDILILADDVLTRPDDELFDILLAE